MKSHCSFQTHVFWLSFPFWRDIGEKCCWRFFFFLLKIFHRFAKIPGSSSSKRGRGFSPSRYSRHSVPFMQARTLEVTAGLLVSGRTIHSSWNWSNWNIRIVWKWVIILRQCFLFRELNGTNIHWWEPCPCLSTGICAYHTTGICFTALFFLENIPNRGDHKSCPGSHTLRMSSCDREPYSSRSKAIDDFLLSLLIVYNVRLIWLICIHMYNMSVSPKICISHHFTMYIYLTMANASCCWPWHPTTPQPGGTQQVCFSPRDQRSFRVQTFFWSSHWKKNIQTFLTSHDSMLSSETDEV